MDAPGMTAKPIPTVAAKAAAATAACRNLRVTSS